MTNIENYVFNIENDNITKKGAQALLSNVICELGFLSAEEWAEIFKLMNSNSLGGKTNNKEAYVIALSKILLKYAIEINYMFIQNKKEFYIFNSKYWIKIELDLLIKFFKDATKKVGIPEYIGYSVTFINKLYQQFKQDVYFEKYIEEDYTYINLQNGILNINKNCIKFEKHHPKYFLTYILDFEYIENSNNDNFIKLLNNIT